MKKIVRLTERDLRRIVKRTINEDYKNASELFDMEYRKILRGIYELKNLVESGDKEQAINYTESIIRLMDRLKSFVDEMRETR